MQSQFYISFPRATGKSEVMQRAQPQHSKATRSDRTRLICCFRDIPWVDPSRPLAINRTFNLDSAL